MKLLAALSSVLGLCSLASSQTAEFSRVSASARADNDVSIAGVSTDAQEMDQASTLDPLFAVARAYDETADGSLEYRTSVRAAFDSAAKGVVSTFQYYNAVVINPTDKTLQNIDFELFTYRFSVLQPSVLTLNHKVASSGNAFGLRSFDLYVEGVGFIDLSPDAAMPDSEGTILVPLGVGTHTMKLFNQANRGSKAADFGSSYGAFEWEITPVPEPASMVALASGVALLLRRRRGA